MPQGTYIPVFTTERLKFKSGGRGLVIDDDATNFDVATWTGVSGGAVGGTKKFLPAASATAWWKVKDDAGNSYYLPLYNCKF